MGAGGEAGQPSLPLPDDCEPRMGSEDAATCRLGLFCGSTPNLVNCHTAKSGNWQCSCELGHKERVYEIDGATGLRACAIAGGLCAEDELELGDEECVVPVDTSSADDCTIELSCGRPITVSFASGVDAWLMEYGSATCFRAETGEHFECACDHDDARVEYAVLADSGALACGPLVDFCIDETEPSFDGPTTCLEPRVRTDIDYCWADQTCAKSIPLTDDVRLAQMAMRAATCESPGATGSDCYCSTRVGSFGFSIEAEPVAESCASSVLNCAEDASIEATGELDCQPTSQVASGDSCEVDLACSQPATVDGREIVASGRLEAYCRRAEVGQSWWCSCASNQDTTVFELGAASSTAWEVCAAAPDQCLERMPVFIGLYGDYVPLPDPLPAQ